MLCVGVFTTPTHASFVQNLFPASGKRVTLQNLAAVLALPVLATAGELCYRGYQNHKATVGKDVTAKSCAHAVKDAVFNKAAWKTTWNDAQALVKKSDSKAWQRIKDLYAQHPALVITTALALTYATSTTLRFAYLKRLASHVPAPKPPAPAPAPQPAPAPTPPVDPKETERLEKETQEAELALMAQEKAKSVNSMKPKSHVLKSKEKSPLKNKESPKRRPESRCLNSNNSVL